MTVETRRYKASKESSSLRKLVIVAPIVAGVAIAGCTVGNSHPSSVPVSTTITAPALSSTSVAAPETTLATTATTEPGLAGCTPYFNPSVYHNHEYEVCTAYVANTGEVALRAFYEYGNNTSSDIASTAQHHFETRYWEQPRALLEQRVDSWPKTDSLGGNDIDASIQVTSVSANLSADRGLLETRESWRITAPDGTVLYDEPVTEQSVTMCRGKLPYPAIGGVILHHPLHEWVVVSFSNEPSFDCFAFDTANNIEP